MSYSLIDADFICMTLTVYMSTAKMEKYCKLAKTLYSYTIFIITIIIKNSAAKSNETRKECSSLQKKMKTCIHQEMYTACRMESFLRCPITFHAHDISNVPVLFLST